MAVFNTAVLNDWLAAMEGGGGSLCEIKGGKRVQIRITLGGGGNRTRWHGVTFSVSCEKAGKA